MKHILCTALAFLLLIGSQQAEETSAVMELRWDSNPSGIIMEIVFSADGKKVAMGGDFVLHLWDLERLPTPVVRPAIINF